MNRYLDLFISLYIRVYCISLLRNMRERSRDSSMHFIGIYLLEPEQLILMKAQEGGQLVFCPPLENKFSLAL